MLPLLRNSCRDGMYKHPGTTGSPRVGSVPTADYGATRHRPEKLLNLLDCLASLATVGTAVFAMLQRGWERLIEEIISPQ